MSFLKFEIGEHKYVGTLHNTSDGSEIVDALLAIGAGPVATALVGAMAVRGNDVSVDMGAAFREIDVEALSGSLRDNITKVGLLKTLAPKLLGTGYWARDGLKLSKAEYDKAYAGNYGELIAAAREVFRLNGFLSVLDTFTSGD